MKTTADTIFSNGIDEKEVLGKKNYFLVVIFGKENDLGKEIEIDDRIITVGRSSEASLVVTDPLVSRKHFKVYRDGEKFFVEDLDSLNGTYVNQVKLSGRHEVKDGSIIAAGRTIFKFEARSQLESLFHQYLYTAATTDRMTGLFNRYYFIDQLKKQVSYARRYKKQFVLLMGDIDDFKKINDTYGHQVGDEVLKYVAFKILSSVRENDICARYGGEEFIVLLPETDYENGLLVAERIRTSLLEEAIEANGEEITITISIGLASFPEDSNLWEELIRIADKRLYKAKELGKNRVVGKDS